MTIWKGKLKAEYCLLVDYTILDVAAALDPALVVNFDIFLDK